LHKLNSLGWKIQAQAVTQGGNGEKSTGVGGPLKKMRGVTALNVFKYGTKRKDNYRYTEKKAREECRVTSQITGPKRGS